MQIVKMLSGVRPSNTHSEPSGKTGFGLGGKHSSKQRQNSNIVQETVLPTKAKQSLKHQDRLKAKSCTSKPYGDLSHELTQHANDRTLVQPKNSGNCQQLSVILRTKKDDELVKYMSNLPSYLQRVERTENIQDKALNVGVLDWTLLESWKCNQKGTPTGVANYAPLPSCNLSTKMMTRSSTLCSPAHNETLACQSKQHSSLRCRKNSSNNDGISGAAKSSMQDVMLIQDVQNASKSHFGRHKRASGNYESFDRNSSVMISERGKRRELNHRITSKFENRSSNPRYNGMPIKSKESLNACGRESKQRVEDMQGSDIKREDLKQKSTSSMGASSSKRGSYDISLSTAEKKNVDNSETMKRIELQESTINLPSQHQVDGKKNIVLLIPRKHPQNSFLMQRRRSFDENVAEANQNTLSDGFSDKEVHSSELDYEIPHSCPLPSTAETNTEQKEMAPDATRTQDAELPTYVNSSNRNPVETSKSLDQDAAELAATKGRHPSPNRRFSFSLGRMTRSFSFKESSAVPQLSSTYVSVKSGPVISRASADLDNSNREKGSGPNRARSSPLRRILDPLLKSKGVSPSHSAETDMPFRGSLNSYSFKSIDATESLQNEKHEGSSIKAQMMLTTRNGLPLFRFVINSSNIIAAAPVKNLTSPGKSDPGCSYALYTIDEIKKKSGSWLNHSNKEKGCGFVYNVVGQMKLSNNSSLDLSEQKPNSQCMVKESVLFGVELRQTGQASQRLMPNTELAAVVVKMPGQNTGFDRQDNDKEENITQKGVSWCLPENERSDRCTVILPGGIHSLPNIGVPSSLIHRWRSGGSCDCGGWDVGCKLRILSSENKHQKLPLISNACQTSNCFELFSQVEAQQDKPIFSMAPIEKEKYSVEFSPSISLLQAFFISITVVSCQKSSSFIEESNLFEEKILRESSNANNGMKKIRTTVLAEAPVKYTPSPPVSPVGRV